MNISKSRQKAIHTMPRDAEVHQISTLASSRLSQRQQPAHVPCTISEVCYLLLEFMWVPSLEPKGWRLKCSQMMSNGINGCVWNYGTQMYPGYPKISWLIKLIIIDHQLQLTFLGHLRSPCQGAGTQWGVVLPAKWWPDCLALPVASPNLQHMFFQNSWNEKHTLEREREIYIYTLQYVFPLFVCKCHSWCCCCLRLTLAYLGIKQR